MTTTFEDDVKLTGPEDSIPGLDELAPPDEANSAGGADSLSSPDAPYGLKADGTPRKSPAGRRAGPTSRRRTPARSRASAPPPPKATPGPRPAPAKSATPDYREPLLQIMQACSIPLAMLAGRNPALGLDADTFVVFGPVLADGINDTAKVHAGTAAILERCLSLAPALPIIAASVPFCLQICANHGWLPPGTPGTIPPDQLHEAAAAIVMARQAS